MQIELKNKALTSLIFISAFWFLFLCLLHYFSKRPLWLDENFIFENIKQSNIPQLFGTLKNNQVFPRVYLVAVKLFAQHFSYNTLALRFFPLLFMFLGFLTWFNAYKLESKTNLYLFVLIFSFASSHFTTYYAAELKQYSCDLFTAGIYTLFISSQKKYFNKEVSIKRLWLFSLLTPFLIFFSYISLLIAWVILYNYLFFIKNNKELKPLFITNFFLVSVFCLLLYQLDIRHSLKIQANQDYWKDYFISTASFYNFFKSLTEGLRNLTVRWFAETKLAMGLATIFMPFCLVAIFKSFKVSFKKFKGAVLDINMLSGVLILELFILGIFKIYPFTGARVTLFISPFIFYMIVKGIYLTEKIKFIFRPLLGVYILFLCAVSIYLFLDYLKLYAN